MARVRLSSLGRPARARWAPLVVVAAALVCAGPASAFRLPSEEPGRPVRVYVMWDRQYLCLAAKVPDTIMTGTSSAPMSTPEQDDAIEFDFEVPGPVMSAYRLIISAAGGMTLLTRDARGQWRADPAWVSGTRTIKYSVEVNGTLNDPSDLDTAYNVECAIPWEFLSGNSLAGLQIGFNVVCWLQGENQGLASWSPSVREPDQVGDAARWGRMEVKLGAGLNRASGSLVSAPFVAQIPFIDGRLEAGEWLAAATLDFDLPAPMIEPSPAPSERIGAMTTLLAVYRYDWDGRPGANGGAPLWTADSSPATADQPRTGAGPWVSYASVDWHADQLQEFQRAGLDVLLAEYSSEAGARRTWARAGLDFLGQALKERRAKGQGYPLVGLMLDTAGLSGTDLRTEAGRGRLYGLIREFFLHVPAEFWAEIGARPDQGRAGGVPIYLGDPTPLAGWDASFTSYCEDRFAQDFGGARLVWLGSEAWRAGGAELYGYLSLPLQSGVTLSGADGARAVGLSPGFLPPPGTRGAVRDRKEGQAYRSDWQRALAARPELVLINSWNDYENGTEVAPSRQHGVVYVDMTRYFQSRLGSQEPYHLRLKQQRLPAAMAGGVDYQVEFLVENVGTADLTTDAKVSVDYEIRRISDGKVVAKAEGVQGLSAAAGQTKRLPVVIPTKGEGGKPLPAGDYTFTLRVVRSKVAYFRSRWFAKALAELPVPFHVGEVPARQASVVSTSLPASMETGSTREVIVRLRNDGTSAWRPGEVRLSYHWLRCRDDLEASSADMREPLADGARAELPGPVAPGETVSVLIPVAAVDRSGRALPPDGSGAPLSASSSGDLWHYRLQWDLVTGEEGWFSAESRAAGEEAIELLPYSVGVTFESAAVPASLGGGETAEVEIAIANGGSHTWRAGEASIAPRWYRWDGRPAGTAATPTALTADLAPGERLLMTAKLLAPSEPGPYWVTWELTPGDGDDAPEGGAQQDLALSQVLVPPGSTRPVDLGPYANVRGIVRDSYRARGDFDGKGDSLPAEWLPPDQTGIGRRLYPSGYYAPGRPATNLSFSFPDLTSGIGGAVACAGQTLPLGEAGAARLHLMLASTEGPQPTSFGLGDASGRVDEVSFVAPPWDQRVPGLPVAAYSPFLRTLSSDDASRQAYLYHVVLEPPSGRATSLLLPNAPWIKIIALTVEEP